MPDAEVVITVVVLILDTKFLSVLSVGKFTGGILRMIPF